VTQITKETLKAIYRESQINWFGIFCKTPDQEDLLLTALEVSPTFSKISGNLNQRFLSK
jgi:hypothetical protein